MHIVLLGDSIFDNASYVLEGESVSDLLAKKLPNAKITLAAVDGDVGFFAGNHSRWEHHINVRPRVYSQAIKVVGAASVEIVANSEMSTACLFRKVTVFYGRSDPSVRASPSWQRGDH